MKNKEVSAPQQAVLLGCAAPNVRGSAHGNHAAQLPSVIWESESTAALRLRRSRTPFPVSKIGFYFYVPHSFCYGFGPASLSLQGLCWSSLGFCNICWSQRYCIPTSSLWTFTSGISFFPCTHFLSEWKFHIWTVEKRLIYKKRIDTVVTGSKYASSYLSSSNLFTLLSLRCCILYKESGVGLTTNAIQSGSLSCRVPECRMARATPCSSLINFNGFNRRQHLHIKNNHHQGFSAILICFTYTKCLSINGAEWPMALGVSFLRKRRRGKTSRILFSWFPSTGKCFKYSCLSCPFQ